MMEQFRNYIDRLRLAMQQEVNPLGQWIEQIHHAAVYTDFLNIVQESEESVRAGLANGLAQWHGASFDVVALEASQRLSWLALLQAISQCFINTESFDDPVALSDTLLDKARERYATGGVLMVVIDNSHVMDAELLNQIGHFSLLSQRCISFVLLGSAGFADVIREGPAQSMKQYILNPADSSPKVIHHHRIQDSFTKWLGGSFTELQNTAPWIKKVTDPVRNGGFPLGHSVAATILIVLIVGFFLLLPGGEGQSTAPITEVTLPDPRPPALVDVTGNSVGDGLSGSHNDGMSGANVLGDTSVGDSQSFDALGPQQTRMKGFKEDVESSELSSNQGDGDEYQEKVAVEMFSIQLLGVGDRESAIKFIDVWKGKVGLPMGYLQTELNRRPWFVVLVGEFSDKAKAKQRIPELPAPLLQSKPWVRFVDADVSWISK